MRYIGFSVEDFIEDEKFKDWIYYPSPEKNYFWESWLAKNPDMKATVSEAKKLLLTLQFNKKTLSESKKNAIWNLIEKENNDFDLNYNSEGIGKLYRNPDSNNRSFKLRHFMYAAAAISLAIISTIFFYRLF